VKELCFAGVTQAPENANRDHVSDFSTPEQKTDPAPSPVQVSHPTTESASVISTGPKSWLLILCKLISPQNAVSISLNQSLKLKSFEQSRSSLGSCNSLEKWIFLFPLIPITKQTPGLSTE